MTQAHGIRIIRSMTLSRHTPSSLQPLRQRGFTLIELMIAGAVVAILVAVALPSFLDSIRKSRRSEAFAALNAIQQAQERWRANHTTYTSDLTAAPNGLGVTTPTANGYYTLTVDDDIGASGYVSSYSATAIAVGGTSQANDGDCTHLRVRVTAGNIINGSAGAGAYTEAAVNPCWSR